MISPARRGHAMAAAWAVYFPPVVYRATMPSRAAPWAACRAARHGAAHGDHAAARH
ncbi:hypothetical protein [Streptomyces sp. IBSBF 2435]|uniref:hypothetical protein n=1 Tax=Streptomyces sp. IBSBF 2435 TaxID=2903531 RepID=UPI002FDC2748